MTSRVRTLTGWREYADEWGAAIDMHCSKSTLGAHVIEHNAFMNEHHPLTKYKATWSARKSGALGTWAGVAVEFEGPPGLTRATCWDYAWGALDAAGYEPNHLISLESNGATVGQVVSW